MQFRFAVGVLVGLCCVSCRSDRQVNQFLERYEQASGSAPGARLVLLQSFLAEGRHGLKPSEITEIAQALQAASEPERWTLLAQSVGENYPAAFGEETLKQLQEQRQQEACVSLRRIAGLDGPCSASSVTSYLIALAYIESQAPSATKKEKLYSLLRTELMDAHLRTAEKQASAQAHE